MALRKSNQLTLRTYKKIGKLSPSCAEIFYNTKERGKKHETVDKGTIIRSTTLVLAMANQVIAIIGASTFANSVWYQIASVVVTVISSLVSAWENNDWTYYAKLGTGVLDALEDGKITVEEVQELLDKHKVEEKTE